MCYLITILSHNDIRYTSQIIYYPTGKCSLIGRMYPIRLSERISVVLRWVHYLSKYCEHGLLYA